MAAVQIAGVSSRVAADPDGRDAQGVYGRWRSDVRYDDGEREVAG